jgi:sialic acid synthase SpsE
MIFISEIGLNYNSVFPNCEELIKQSKLAGADIAKFQLGWKGKPGEINFLDEKKISQLYNWSEKYEIDLMFSVFTKDALKLLKKFPIKRIKIASRTLKNDMDLCKEILSLGLKTFISLGMWEDKSNLPFKSENIKYMWCKSSYPTSNDDLKLLPKNFKDKPISGYSDHSIGIDTALLAISRGATIVEEHFTLDKSSTFIRDHILSSEPEEMKLLIKIGREINKKLSYGI